MTTRTPETGSAEAAPDHRVRARLELSATQLVATALAAVTATIAASYLGVSGTVIGAGVASVVSAIGNAVYSHSLRRTRDRVRGVTPARRPTEPGPDHVSLPGARSVPPRAHAAGENVITSRNAWRGVAIGSIAVFAAVLAVVTGVEIIAGRPVSDLVRGDSGTGTSLFGTHREAAGGAVTTPIGTPTVTRTVTPSVVVSTPTVTRTAPAITRTAPAITRTVAPTVASTPSTSPVPPSGAAQTGSRPPVG
jgi:hypothetical protein